jgi:cysteine desulfurase family protein (TIGR01976 family)
MTVFDPTPLRAQFPALNIAVEGRQPIFFDSPGGTQVPERVIEAVTRYYREQNANAGGAFITSNRTDEVVLGARQAMADLLNAPSSQEILFGPNMTTLTFHLARSIAETIRPGDEIVLTNLDHDANVTPWTDLAAAGAEIKFVDFDPADCTLDPAAFERVLSPRTRLVAVTHASNAVGTIPDVASITQMAHEVGALVYVDAVQYVPHGPVDVQALGCDFLACSAYKFFGSHLGVVWGKAEHLERLKPHKVRPAKDVAPYRWETGTLNHEGIAGTGAAVAYLGGIGDLYGEPYAAEYAGLGFAGRRLQLKTAMRAVKTYEETLSARLLDGLESIPDITIYGLRDRGRLHERVPTVAFTWPRLTPRATAEYLGRHGICCWNGNYYALRLMERLGLEAEGGAVRIGLTHIDTFEEIDRLIELLRIVPLGN